MGLRAICFAAPYLPHPSLRPTSAPRRALCHAPLSPPHLRRRHARISRLHMSASGSPPPPEDSKSPSPAENSTQSTPTEKEVEEPKFSFWGVASFGIIFFIFMLTIIATLSRDFIPGGMTGPA